MYINNSLNNYFLVLERSLWARGNFWKSHTAPIMERHSNITTKHLEECSCLNKVAVVCSLNYLLLTYSWFSINGMFWYNSWCKKIHDKISLCIIMTIINECYWEDLMLCILVICKLFGRSYNNCTLCIFSLNSLPVR